MCFCFNRVLPSISYVLLALQCMQCNGGSRREVIFVLWLVVVGGGLAARGQGQAVLADAEAYAPDAAGRLL